MGLVINSLLNKTNLINLQENKHSEQRKNSKCNKNPELTKALSAIPNNTLISKWGK